MFNALAPWEISSTPYIANLGLQLILSAKILGTFFILNDESTGNYLY